MKAGRAIELLMGGGMSLTGAVEYLEGVDIESLGDDCVVCLGEVQIVDGCDSAHNVTHCSR